MTTVSSDRDRVVLTLVPRGTDLVCSPDAARRLAEALRVAAHFCGVWVRAGGERTVLTGEQRGADVRSWDGNVNVRFATPFSAESIPYDSAVQLADLLEAKAVEAEGRLQVIWRPHP
jgi:hypothetical protein